MNIHEGNYAHLCSRNNSEYPPNTGEDAKADDVVDDDDDDDAVAMATR